MQYIPKKLSNEPESLHKYRTTTPNPSYNSFGDKEDIRNALLKEQGHLCAYCLNRISDEWNSDLRKIKTEIEHFKSQLNYPNLQLDYNNMLGVCNGHSGENKNEFLDCNNIYLKIKDKNPSIKRKSQLF